MTIALRTLILAWLLALAACTSSPTQPVKPIADDATTRELDAGPIRGFVNAAGGHSWLGLPYAAPPVGERRWRAPIAPDAWNMRRDALGAGSPCIQYGSPLGGVGTAGTRQGSEDCLYLNVYAPRLSPEAAREARLPVMVWIHGGGNTTGHAAFWDGSVLAQRENTIVIMINYRLGPFGWFKAPVDENASPEDRSGNYGTLDTIEALRWVSRNAAAFGGDPDNVTVFGESAGGTNALALLIAPQARGLFHRMIIQSLGFGFAREDAPAAARATERALHLALQRAGRATDVATAARIAPTLSPSEQATLLRALDPWDLYSTYERAATEWDRIPTVFQDGYVLRQGVITELLADPNQHHDVPVILGTNRDEPKIFMAFDPRHVRTAFGLPISLKDPVRYDQEARYRSLLWKADGVDSLASVLAEHGAPAWGYRWDWDEQGRAFGLVDISRIVGAAHGLEISFVLGQFDLGPQSNLLFHEDNESARLQLSERMMGYWAEFARHGEPRRGGRDDGLTWLPWPRTTAESTTPRDRLLIFDTASDGGIRMSDVYVDREAVVQLMEREIGGTQDRCEAFRATFRNRIDTWADREWLAFSRRSSCSGPRVLDR
ncbi:MAG: carboxylesterase/lipase family protein [Steroidobacteraceae bacterium]